MKKCLSLISIVLGLCLIFSCSQAVSSSSGGRASDVSSKRVIVIEPIAPVIYAQPQSFSIKSAEDIELRCYAELTENPASFDRGNLSFQWFKDGVAVDKTENATATDVCFIETVETLAEGDSDVSHKYYCEVTNTLNEKKVTVKSEVATVTVTNAEIANPPKITSQPFNWIAESDSSTDKYIDSTFSVAATGDNLSYQWYKASDLTSSGEAIFGATNKNYKEIRTENAFFWCEVTNTVGSSSQSIISDKVEFRILTGLGYNHPSYLEEQKFSPYDMFGGSEDYGWRLLDSPLGAHVITKDSKQITSFAVYSKNATRVLLEIYDDNLNKDAKYDYWMVKCDDDIWRAEIVGDLTSTVANPISYAFRAWGPNWQYDSDWERGDSSKGFVVDYDSKGNRFNPNKVLFDPYSYEMTHDRSGSYPSGLINSAIYTSGATNRTKDTGKFAPKSYVVTDSTNFGTKPEIDAIDSIIYEAHLRGLTKHPSSASLQSILSGFSGFESVVDVPDEYRGTYKGAAYLAKYLKTLGITTVELLPIHESDNDCNPDNSSGGNFWAYMTYGYFAPDRRYSYDKTPGGPTKEFKEMVKTFHGEGLEVYLDVVYNHSGEGGCWQGSRDDFEQVELTFMRGLDNSTYYSLLPLAIGAYWETSGCGNNLQCDNPAVRQLILDSLKYWTEVMGVDGFRFDLAPVLGREFKNGDWPLNTKAKTLTDIAAYGESQNVEMIAEAWDASGTGYSVGNFPSGWGDWNGVFRDSARRFLKNDEVNISSIFAGSQDMYSDVSGKAGSSINLIVAHDGLTLADLVSYPVYDGTAKAKYNGQAWPFGKSDGGSDGNDCWDSVGYESKSWFISNNYTVEAFRRQRLRNFYVFQTFARGVPMILYGDELGRTQNGNNNAYNLDSVATWTNYNFINTDTPQVVSTQGGGAYNNKLGTDAVADNKNGLFLFVKELFAIRKADAVLRDKNYSVSYEFASSDGSAYSPKKNDSVRVLISDGTPRYAICMSMDEKDVKNFVLPKKNGYKWVKIVDTSYDSEDQGSPASNITTELSPFETVEPDSTTQVNPQSIAVFKAVLDASYVYTNSPVIDVASCEFTSDTNPLSVTITNSYDSDFLIYYTLDGSDPASSSTRFTLEEKSTVISVDKSLTIRAICVRDLKSSDEVSRTYRLVQDVWVYFLNNQGWGTSKAYYWGKSSLSWPGSVMTKDEGNWYKVKVNTKDSNIIFSYDGTPQTVDLTWSEFKPYFKITGDSGGKKTGKWFATKAEAEN